MAELIQRRMTADVDGEFAVFLIGMRFNKLWKVHQWLPVFQSMFRMLAELYDNPELGFVHHDNWVGRTTMMVQCWRSFEQLEAYAKGKTFQHLPAWAAFSKQIGSNGDVGIWHETYRSRKGDYECVYNNMPRFGLAMLGEHVPADGKRESARERLNG